LFDHLLGGVFEAQHDTTGIDAHEPIEIAGRRWKKALLRGVSF